MLAVRMLARQREGLSKTEGEWIHGLFPDCTINSDLFYTFEIGTGEMDGCYYVASADVTGY